MPHAWAPAGASVERMRTRERRRYDPGMTPLPRKHRASRAVVLLPLLFAACANPAPRAADPFVPAEEASVKPGINDNFKSEDLDVGTFVERFEGESREVFANRARIVEAIGLRPGDDVVDVGAGTGAFLDALATAVGPDGTVYAIDIAEKFVDRLAARALEEGHDNVVAQLCSENSVDLPADSVDAAFICDVYHHFEFPRNTMGSLAHALRDGGQVVIVDFERIPGVSREWVLNHVRAGKDEVFAEMDAFGFEMVEELEVGLEENWAARFRLR